MVSLLYAGLLYFKNPLNKLGKYLSLFLFLIRFITVFILGFLLLSPTLKTKNKQVEKPIVIIGQDNSRSILITKDSISSSEVMNNNISKLVENLSEKNDIDTYLFGDVVVGAIVLSGDGIVNAGVDPVYSASDISYPIFTIALGDTSQSRDSKIDDIRYNSIVYSGDIFPVEVSISAAKLVGNKTNISIFENDKLLSKKIIQFSTDNFRETVVFDVEANVAGKRRFKIVLEPNSDEINSQNNIRNIFVDVLDSRQKILILAFAPHPDIGAIKQSLLINKNYIVDVEYVNRFAGGVEKYDLIVLYQLPAMKNLAIQILTKIVDNEIPTLYILGNQSNLSVFNKYFKGLDIISAVGSNVPAQFYYNNLFSYFSFNNELATQLASLPPLSTPLGNYSLSDGAEVFGWQSINNIQTDFPLITFVNNLGVKSGVIAGEGLWLWRIHNKLKYENSNAVDALVNKAAMFLVADADKRNFKITTRGEYNSFSDVVINAELYNQAFEPENSPDVSLILTNEIGETFNFAFSAFDDYYKLNMNKLPIGIYNYVANVTLGKDSYSDKGEFIVQQLDNESRNLNANHRMLSQLANEHEGAMYYPNEIDKLIADINNLEGLKSKIHYEDKFVGLNSIIYILIGLVFLLSFEWFVRKYFGNY